MADWITPKTAAERLGVTTRWLRQLCKKGVLPKKGGGKTARHPWPELRRAYDAYIVQSVTKHDGRLDVQWERAALLRVQRHKAELELGQLRKELMTVEHLNNALDGAFTRVRVILLPLPRRAAADVFAATTLKETIAILERYVSEVLQQLYDADDVPESDEAA